MPDAVLTSGTAQVEERLHEALGQQVPVSLYDGASREMPERLPRPEYPGHFVVLLARLNERDFHLRPRAEVLPLLPAQPATRQPGCLRLLSEICTNLIHRDNTRCQDPHVVGWVFLLDTLEEWNQ